MIAGKIQQIMAMIGNPSPLADMQSQGKAEKASFAFGALLGQATDGSGRQAAYFKEGNLESTFPQADASSHAAYAKESAQAGYRGSQVGEGKPEGIQDKLPKDAPEKLRSFEKKITGEIAEKLGVSEEEVAAQMEAMGLTAIDLMDLSNLTALALELSGNEDAGALLLNEDFQQLFGNILEMSQELAPQLGLAPEEMKQFSSQLGELIQDGVQKEAMPQPIEGEVLPDAGEAQPAQDESFGNLQDIAQGEGSQEPLRALEKTPAQPGEAQAEGQRPEEAASDAQEPVANVPEESQEQEPDAKSGDDSQGLRQQAQTSQPKAAEKAEPQQTHVTYQTVTHTVAQGQAVEITQTAVQSRIDVEGIIRQISQMTRIVVSQAESSIEMQLNPASLGKVYLQVVAKDGAITAQIAAQNEAVKKALESQVSLLRENMAEQGLKVEAIEVTVASHGFDRSLEGNQQEQAREQQEEAARRAAGRNRGDGRLDEFDGTAQEESLAARMMSEQGNRMNLTA